MSDPVSGELVGQGGTQYEGANDVYGGAIMRSEGSRARHRGLGMHVGLREEGELLGQHYLIMNSSCVRRRVMPV